MSLNDVSFAALTVPLASDSGRETSWSWSIECVETVKRIDAEISLETCCSTLCPQL